MRFIRFGQGGDFPAHELQSFVFEALHRSKQNRVAIMAGEETLDQLPPLGSARLDPEEDYRWSGLLVQKKVRKRARRVVGGTYDEWFQWYMGHQRFRAFQTIILIEPLAAVSDEERGGYIDGLLARLMGKVQETVIVSDRDLEAPPSTNELRAKEVIRALLYGTRLTRPEVLQQIRRTFVPVAEETLAKVFTKYTWRISKRHPRYQLEEFDEELLQGMVARFPPEYIDGKPNQIEQFFYRSQRFKPELELPDELITARTLEDVGRFGWVTVPYEGKKLSAWLDSLNKRADPRLEEIYESRERVSDEQWSWLLSPSRPQVRRVLDGLVAESKLERRTWYREVGRPAFAYLLPGKAPFLDKRCGQCAFYASAKRRCNLWWLVNKRQVFFDERWRQAGSPVSGFEIHKMRYASKIGPHSSACTWFLDKKRDHLRKAIPERCEICGEAIPLAHGTSVACKNCRTKYMRARGKVRVMTAYEHEYNRLYREVTGGDANVDLEAWRRKMRENLQITRQTVPEVEDFEDILATDAAESEPEPPRVWPSYDQALQERVDELAKKTDLARRFSIAMARSALNATRRIMSFAKLYSGDADPLVAQQETYLRLIGDASPNRLLPYEAQVMKQYWLCYGLALKRAQQWFGPRKRSRFVREFVEDPAGRARGYSPVDAAINYLHQRRLRQAERINKEVGFPGTCDGFLHRERYNSRKIGLLLDMIDPFKFADREALLLVVLDQGLTWRDFRIETDRRGSSFYYPMAAAEAKLIQAGSDADNLVVKYQRREMSLTEAYGEFAAHLFRVLSMTDLDSIPLDAFVFATS